MAIETHAHDCFSVVKHVQLDVPARHVLFPKCSLFSCDCQMDDKYDDLPRKSPRITDSPHSPHVSPPSQAQKQWLEDVAVAEGSNRAGLLPVVRQPIALRPRCRGDKEAAREVGDIPESEK